jgi:predicted transcriptional regulator
MSHRPGSPTAQIPSPSPAALDMMIRIVMSQTEMTHDEVAEALQRTNYDLKKVIREYMTGTIAGAGAGSMSTAPTSANQLRFAEIRNFMDRSVETFRRNQEISRIYQEVAEKKKQAAAGAVASGAVSKL